MMRMRVVTGVLLGLVLAGGWLLAQDQKPAPRAKGQLPPNWGKLGLSEEQKQKIYSVQTEFRGKIDSLEDQIRQLRKQEGAELAKVLTDAQRARLREIIASKSLSDPPAKDDKKPSPDKKP